MNLGFVCSSLTFTTQTANACSPWTPCYQYPFNFCFQWERQVLNLFWLLWFWMCFFQALVLKELRFHIQSALVIRGPTYKVPWPFDQVVLWDHVKNWNHYISNTTVPMPTKLGRKVAYLKRLLPIKLLDPLVTWFS